MTTHALHAVEDWGRSVFDRVAVFTASPAATFLTLLFELLLSLCVSEAKVELHAVVVTCDAVEVFDDSFSDIASLEAGNRISESSGERVRWHIPCKANFLADSRWTITADLGRDSMERQKMLAKIL